MTIVVAAIRMGARGVFIDPANYDYRIVSNQRKLKIQLKVPSFKILFGDQWEDYQTADSFLDARLRLYKTKYFDSVEEAEDYVDKCKNTEFKNRMDNDFTTIP